MPRRTSEITIHAGPERLRRLQEVWPIFVVGQTCSSPKSEGRRSTAAGSTWCASPVFGGEDAFFLSFDEVFCCYKLLEKARKFKFGEQSFNGKESRSKIGRRGGRRATRRTETTRRKIFRSSNLAIVANGGVNCRCNTHSAASRTSLCSTISP